ncbi:DUF2142 domain-containing protein [Modestobacter versicolor]|uniref:DUF2142 domain-containing protein n=1 Tax=Modestobacter versicolor TaxID=429133 RepID=UPI0011B3E545|nr:DUF2142 domain-containing protein [Modestobacter versicolor]
MPPKAGHHLGDGRGLVVAGDQDGHVLVGHAAPLAAGYHPNGRHDWVQLLVGLYGNCVRTNVGRAEPRAFPLTGGRGRGLRFFLLSWFLLSVAISGWAITTPLFASPDEPAHVVKAAAVARGELTGRTIEQPGTYFEIITGVEVPEYYADSMDNTECFLQKASEAADCAPDFAAGDNRDAEVQTWIGRYPPLYYAIVGLPSLVSDGTAAVLGMRVVSAVLCAGFFALGLWALRTSRHGRVMLAAGWLAVTPTALFFGGMVNSSGLEIAAGFATWCLLVPLVRDPAAHHVRGRLAAGMTTAVVLLNTRPGSGLLALLIAVCLVVMATREFWRAALAERRWVPASTIGAIGAVCAGAWLLAVDPTASLGGIPDSKLGDVSTALGAAIGLTGRYVKEQLAVFGALNVTLHGLFLVLLGGAIALLVLAGLVRGRAGTRWALGLLLVASFVVPVVSQIPSAADLGLIWQGRYGLPMSIGLPIVAMAALTSRHGEDRLTRWSALALTPLVAGVHVAALFWSLWRYGYGFGVPLFSVPLEWTPPGTWTMPVAFVVAVSALSAVVAFPLVPPRSSWRRWSTGRSVPARAVDPVGTEDVRDPEPAAGSATAIPKEPATPRVPDDGAGTAGAGVPSHDLAENIVSGGPNVVERMAHVEPVSDGGHRP